jgi:adenosylcobyric acid synthase
MVQGTASSVGKSLLVAGLCRLLARRGLRVAPFKAQNMSNNAAVCPGGGEIGRAQALQALACGIEPRVELNPILLKPEADARSQLVVLGRAQGSASARESLARRPELWPVVAEALDRLRREFDLVIAEGAGSPAELNLRAQEIVNMRVARHAGAAVLLVGDIDRGGVFASLLGTLALLEPEERALVRGLVVNKLRGDPTLFADGVRELEARSGLPVLGVVPYLTDHGLPDEDAAAISLPTRDEGIVQVACMRLPRMANFDDLLPLAREPGMAVRFVERPEQLRAPDLVVLPGNKATLADLAWLWERGLAERITALARRGTPVLGLCGGYQMLGRVVRDPDGMESGSLRELDGLGLLPVETTLTPEKRLGLVEGRVSARDGFWSALDGCPVGGYEIHLGQTTGEVSPFVRLADGRPDGAHLDNVAGTYLHGFLDRPEPRRALVRALAARNGLTWSGAESDRDTLSARLDRLADTLETSLDLARLESLVDVRIA